MEFKITKDKIARLNKMLLYGGQNKENILTSPGICRPFSLSHRFCGEFEVDPNFGEKRPRGPGLLKQLCPALTPSRESCDKYPKTPQTQLSRLSGRQKPGKVSIFSLV